MMRIKDAVTLAYTKFKTRRIRLAVAVIVSGILFVAFSAASFMARGAIASVESFSQEGFAKRYITSLQPFYSDEFNYSSDKELIMQAKELDKKLIAEKKAEAVRLDISYDSNNERLAVSKSQGPNGEQEYLDTSVPHVQELLQVRREKDAAKVLSKINSYKDTYQVSGIYTGIPLASMGGPFLSSIPSISTIKNGKEDIAANNNQYYGPTTQGLDGIKSGLSIIDDKLLEPFLLKDQSITVDATGVIPVVAPYSAVEEILGLKKLSDSAKSQEKLDRLKEVRQKASAKTFSVCVRNATSTERLQNAVDQQMQLLNSKNNKDYVKPELLYDKPTEPCGDVVTVRDVRSSEQKTLDAKKDKFLQKFGKEPPIQRRITFKIVGVVADPPSFGSFSVESLVGELLNSNLGSGWFTPRSALSALPEYSGYVAAQDKTVGMSSLRYVELTSANEAKRFAKEQTCAPDFTSFMGPGLPPECEQKQQYFYINSFGSNSVAMESIRTGFSKVFVKALMVASLVSALILMGTVGRVIADGRRETAVFRAIGAKRLDIAQIYITYVVMIGIAVCMFAIGTGGLVASYFDARYQSALTVKALLAYNASDLSKTFHINNFDRHDMLLLAGVIIGGSLLSALGPLVSNLRRNPIKDMRDER